VEEWNVGSIISCGRDSSNVLRTYLIQLGYKNLRDRKREWEKSAHYGKDRGWIDKSIVHWLFGGLIHCVGGIHGWRINRNYRNRLFLN